MRGRPAALGAALAVSLPLAAALAHDMFLKPDRFVVAQDDSVVVRLLNGTFSVSENAVVRRRLRDLSVVRPGGRVGLDPADWRDAGDTAWVTLRTGPAGTYVMGASTHPSTIRLDAKEFNAYLASDGIPDELAARRRDGSADQPAHERYSKHVKALIQVGARPSPVDQSLDYPAELVPLDNPYASPRPTQLRVRALVGGRPVGNQLIVVGGRRPNGSRLPARELRTDPTGLATVALSERGIWYAKFIHMARVTGDSVSYESTWASLTWQVR
jgi:uncharacterized GH25 family protein